MVGGVPFTKIVAHRRKFFGEAGRLDFHWGNHRIGDGFVSD